MTFNITQNIVTFGSYRPSSVSIGPQGPRGVQGPQGPRGPGSIEFVSGTLEKLGDAEHINLARTENSSGGLIFTNAEDNEGLGNSMIGVYTRDIFTVLLETTKNSVATFNYADDGLLIITSTIPGIVHFVVKIIKIGSDL